MIIKTMTVGAFAVNSYLVVCEKTRCAVIIDPGDDEAYIMDVVKSQDARVDYIFLTHGHLDHISGVARIRKQYGCQALMHEKDLFLVKNMNSQAMLFNLQAPKGFIPDKYVHEGDELKVGELVFRVIETPGHSPGSICYRAENIIFVGDTLFYDSIGRTDLIGGSSDDLYASINSKLFVLPPELEIYPGHGPSSTIGDRKQSNPYFAS